MWRACERLRTSSNACLEVDDDNDENESQINIRLAFAYAYDVRARTLDAAQKFRISRMHGFRCKGEGILSNGLYNAIKSLYFDRMTANGHNDAVSSRAECDVSQSHSAIWIFADRALPLQTCANVRIRAATRHSRKTLMCLILHTFHPLPESLFVRRHAEMKMSCTS